MTMAAKCSDEDFILTRDELKYLLGFDETEALALVIAQQDEDGEHAFVDVLDEDVDLIIDGDWPVLKRGKELDLVNVSLGPTLGVLDGNIEEDLPKLCLEMPQTELEGSSQKNQLEYVFDVSMFTSEGLLAHGQARMEETVACCLGEFGGLLAEEKAPSLDGLLDEDLLVHGQARMEETEACRLDEFGGLLAEKKAPSSDGLLVDSEAQTLDDDADFVKFCLSIQENKDDCASANLIELGNEWQPWEQQAIQEMATTGNNKHGKHMDVLSVSASTWEQQAPQEMAAPSMKKRKAKQQAPGEMAAPSMKKRKAEQQAPQEMAAPRIDRAMMPHRDCPRCFSSNTRFDYINNGKPNQPRYKCRSCDRNWTVGGKLRAAGGRKCKGKSANHNFNI